MKTPEQIRLILQDEVNDAIAECRKLREQEALEPKNYSFYQGEIFALQRLVEKLEKRGIWNSISTVIGANAPTQRGTELQSFKETKHPALSLSDFSEKIGRSLALLSEWNALHYLGAFTQPGDKRIEALAELTKDTLQADWGRKLV